VNDELYSYDRYKGFNIFINDYSGFYYGDIFFNGTQMERDIKAMTGEKCLARCKDKVDAIIHYEGGAE
jgi:hypothetical protein